MSTVILPGPENADYIHPLSTEAYRALGELGYFGNHTERLCGFVFPKMKTDTAALVAR